MNGTLTNWGRWGTDDQKGTLNLVTADVIQRAARLVRSGKFYSLAMPLEAEGVQWPSRHKTWKTTRHGMFASGKGGSDDVVTMHSHSGTHIDALCHVWYENQLYNGFDASEHVTVDGATRNAIENVPSIIGRGVLLDIAGWKGVEHLELGEPVSSADLDACAKHQQITIEQGDIVLVNTGWMNVFAKDRQLFDSGEPGLDMSTPQWLHDHGICAVGADNGGVEVMETMPPEDLPFHFVTIRDLGMYLLENLKLQPLANDHVYEFFLVAAPLPLTTGVGSPINPIAIA